MTPSSRRLDDARRRRPHRRATGLLATLAVVAGLLAGCTTSGGSTPAAVTTAPPTWPPVTPAPPAASAGGAGSAASAEAGASGGAIEARPGDAKILPQVQVVDGYASMYVALENRGGEALTFINTLYDTEPDKLWTPQVTVPYAAGGNALVTRAGRFFPSPAIVAPGADAVYLMGGQQLAMGQPATGTQAFAAPITNIKACLTRGMDDPPGVPVQVKDVSWSESGGVTTVRGTLVETQGSQRPSLPMVGAAFFDAAGRFVGAVVDARGGSAMAPYSQQSFEISGHGVDASRVARVDAYAVIP
jgi:hypothetical protein